MAMQTIQIVINAVDNFSKTFKKATTGMSGFISAGIIAGAAGAAIAGGMIKAVKAANEVETGFAKVNTLMDEGADAQEQFAKFVQDTNVAMGNQGDQIDVLDGLYQTMSAGITDTADAQLFMESATKAAVGGSAELSSVIEAGTKTMAAFGLGAEDSDKVFDIFAGTVKAGQTTMGQLANAFPTVTGAAGEMGVSLEETAGIFAGLTKVMASPEVAATSLNAVLTGLIKPSTDMKDALGELGYESGQEAIETLGLMGTIEALKGTTDGSAEAMGGLFGNVRALRAVFPALGGAAEDIAKSVDIVTDSTGLADKQYEDMADTMDFRLGEAMSNIDNLTSQVGDTIKELLVPVLEYIIPIIESLVQWWKNLDPVMQKAIIIGIAVAGVVLLITAAFFALMLVMSPVLILIFLIAAAIGMLVAFGYYLYKHWSTIMAALSEKWTDFKISLIMLWEELKDAFAIIWAAMKNVFIFVWNKIVSYYEGVINKIIDGVNALTRVMSKLPGIDIPIIPQVDFSSIKGSMTDLGALTSTLEAERAAKRASLEIAAQKQININVEGSIVKEDELTDSIAEQINNKIKNTISI